MPSRAMAVVDIYDALTTDRSYREKMAKEEALHIIRQEALEGRLDKDVVECLADTTS